MKKLAIIAFAAFSASAFATGSSDPEIVIDGISTQTVSSTSSTFKNEADGSGAYALQNVSSNAGNVTIESGAVSSQSTTARNGSMIHNKADGRDAYAVQNVSSNLGEVTIDGRSTQTTTLDRANVLNYASDNTKAVQNVASNNACVKCAPGR